MDMSQTEAQQLKERIESEAPHLIASVIPVDAVGWKAWAVKVVAKGSNLFLAQIESPSEWDEQKQYFLPPQS